MNPPENTPLYLEMLNLVATALGSELLNQVVFVGGCTTGLLLVDDFSAENVRHTDDVDLICHADSYLKYKQFQQALREKGFTEKLEEDAPICAMYLNDLRVDIMPDNDILGFSNRWYPGALVDPDIYETVDGLFIKVVKPVFFVATKLEAYKGRGNNDAMQSHDIEDILTILDGRAQIVEEVLQADERLREYVRAEFNNLRNDDNFAYALQSASGGDVQREDLIWDSIDRIVAGNKE